MIQQPLLAMYPTGIPFQLTIICNDAMAGNDNGDRILFVSGPDIDGSARVHQTQGVGDALITRGRSDRYPSQGIPNPPFQFRAIRGSPRGEVYALR